LRYNKKTREGGNKMKGIKKLVALSACVSLAFVVAACGGSDETTQVAGGITGSEPCKPEGELNAILWEGYATDKSIAGFEKKYGIDVNVTTIATNDEVFAKIRSKNGQYDLIPATTDVSQQYIRSGLVQPLNVEQVPQAENIFTAFEKLPQGESDGKVYGIAHTWSADPILYNADTVKNPEESYEVLFDEQYKGKVGLYDELGSLWVGALAKGYDPYNLTEEQLKEVTDDMANQKELVRKYWSSGDDLIKLMASGEVDVATGWTYVYTELKNQGVNVKRLVPKEGNLGWVDFLMIPVKAGNPCAAYKWMDWALSPEGGSETAVAGWSVASQEVADAIDPELAADLNMDDPEFVNEILLWEEVDRPTYQNAWNQVKNR